MSTLDQFKQHWEPSNKASTAEGQTWLDEASLRKIITARVRAHTKTSFQYFWASFSLHLLVYAMCSHLLIRYWLQTPVFLLSLLGLLVYIPFTVVLLTKFKRVAKSQPSREEPGSIRHYLLEQYQLLNSFFTFKKRYELFLIPVIGAIGVMLVFTLYVPGGVKAFPVGALITYVGTLLACYVAIRSENRKSFVRPLQQLQVLLQEFQE